jgi:hypothetical protein
MCAELPFQGISCFVVVRLRYFPLLKQRIDEMHGVNRAMHRGLRFLRVLAAEFNQKDYRLDDSHDQEKDQEQDNY